MSYQDVRHFYEDRDEPQDPLQELADELKAHRNDTEAGFNDQDDRFQTLEAAITRLANLCAQQASMILHLRKLAGGNWEDEGDIIETREDFRKVPLMLLPYTPEAQQKEDGDV